MGAQAPTEAGAREARGINREGGAVKRDLIVIGKGTREREERGERWHSVRQRRRRV